MPRFRRSSGELLLAVVVAVLLCPGARYVAAQSFIADVRSVLDRRPTTEVYRVKQEDPPTPFTAERVSETETIVLGVMRIYQSTLSATDIDMCGFRPSCSRFGVDSVRRLGFVKGVLLTSDRLTRCNGLAGSARHYAKDASTQKNLDPVDRYRARKP